MDLQFEPINLEKQQAYLDKLAQSKQVTSDYSFSNLFGWGEEYGLSWAFNERLVWIKQEKPRPCYWAPIGDWENTDWQKVFDDHHCVLTRVPEKLSVIWQDLLPGRLKIEEVRNHWDYLYDIKVSSSLCHAATLSLLFSLRFLRRIPFRRLVMRRQQRWSRCFILRPTTSRYTTITVRHSIAPLLVHFH